MKKSTTITLVAVGALAAIAGVVTYALINKKDSKCICSCSKDKKATEEKAPIEETHDEVVCEDCVEAENVEVAEATKTEETAETTAE